MADYEDDTGYTTNGVVSPTYVQPTTTEEARSFSRKILNSYMSKDNQGVEDDYVGQLAKSSGEATQALRSARTRLESQNYDPRRIQMAFAAGNLAPTRSGSMGESFGKAFSNVGDELEKQQNFNLDRSKQELGYDLAIPEQEQKVVEARLSLQKLHEQQQGPLAREAMTQLGRSIPPGGAMMQSPNAKIAAGEGLTPGSPQFIARVGKLDDIDIKNHSATAGTDASPMPDADRLKLANNYGIPSMAPTPWAGLSTKAQLAMQKAEETAGNKALAGSDAGVQQAQDLERQLDRFMELNKEHSTGPMQKVPVIKQITGLEPDSIEMDKISSKIGPLMRQPGMGRMTNLDLQTFLNSTVGRDKPYQVNQDIVTGTKAALHNQLDFDEFQNNYMAVHGHLKGSQEAWNQYLRDNPIFDPKKPVGSYQLNPVRQDYKTYFRTKNGGATIAAQANPGAPNPDDDKPAIGLDPRFKGAVTPEMRADPTYKGMNDAQIIAANTPAKAAGGRVVKGFADGGSTTGVQAPPYKADLADLARSFEQGATGQWGDEANATLTPGNYSTNVAGQRAAMEKFGSAHPVADFGLQAAGGAGTAYALTKGLQTLGEHADSKAGKVAAAIAALGKLVPKNLPARAALMGGAAGAVSGAGSAQNPDQVPSSMLTQGAVGAVTGPLAGLVTKYGVKGLQYLADKVRGIDVPGGVDKVLSTLGVDKMSLDDVLARLNTANRQGVPSTTMADVAGPRTQALARATAARTGPNIDAMTQGLTDRQQGANGRVSDLVNKALKPDDYGTKMEELTQNLYQNAKPLYQAAYNQYPAVKSPDVMNILNNTDVGPKAARIAAKLMKNDQVPIGPVDATGMVRSPSLQYLDYVKRAMDSMVETAEPNGVSSTVGRSIRGVRNAFRDAVDSATTDPATGVSPYSAARQQYAGDLEVRDALRMGREDFSKMSPQELAKAAAGMSFAEKDALRSGVAEHLFRQVGGTPYTTNPAQRIANVPDVATKLQALFDKPADYQKFVGGLSQEMSNFNRAKGVLSTANQGRTQVAASGLGGPNMGEAAYEATLGAAGHPVWAGARAARWLSDKLMHNDTADSAAGILNTTGGAAGKAAVAKLKDQAAQIGQRLAAQRTAGQTAAGATGSVLAPNPWGNQPQPGAQ